MTNHRGSDQLPAVTSVGQFFVYVHYLCLNVYIPCELGYPDREHSYVSYSDDDNELLFWDQFQNLDECYIIQSWIQNTKFQLYPFSVQVAERALYFWNNEYIMSLIEENNQVIVTYLLSVDKGNDAFFIY